MDRRVSLPNARSLRLEWAGRSQESAWTFPSDWDSPAVEALCEAIVGGGDVFPAGERLGRVRAESGVSLGEALADVDQLAGLVAPRYAEILRRAVSLGWAERSSGPGALIVDPLTGLVSREYLQVRLAEVYQSCAAQGRTVSAEFALVVVRLSLSSREVWQRSLPMIVVGECLRVAFDAGETLARLGEPMAVALVRRTDTLPRRVRFAGSLVSSRIHLDPDIAVGTSQTWVEVLPDEYQSALWLLSELGR